MPTHVYTLVQIAAEPRARARDGAIFDKWVVMEEFLPLRLSSSLRGVIKNRLSTRAEIPPNGSELSNREFAGLFLVVWECKRLANQELRPCGSVRREGKRMGIIARPGGTNSGYRAEEGERAGRDVNGVTQE